MTPEEKMARLEKLQKLKRLQELKAQRASLESQQPVAREPVDQFDARGVAQQAARGTLSGFGDELVGGARALIDPLLPNATYDFGDDVSGDTRQGNADYEMYRDDERRYMDQYEQDNPGTALAANLASSVVNPLNKVAPGIGATGGYGARTAGATGRGIVEGAIGGFGEGRGSLDDQFNQAGEGALWGGGVSAGLSGGLGGLGRIASKKRVQQRLKQRDGTFLPIPLADLDRKQGAGGPGNFYRNTVARAYGSQGLLDQQQPFIDAATSRVSKAEDAYQGLKDQATRGKWEIDKTFDEGKRALDRIDPTQDVLDVNANLEIGLQKLKETAARNAEKIDDGFMAIAAKKALPDYAVDDALKGVDLRVGDDTRDAINQWWNQNGFNQVKNRNFKWDAGLKKAIANDLNDDPVLKNSVGGALQDIDRMRARLMDEGLDPDSMSPSEFFDALTDGKGGKNIIGPDGKQIIAATDPEEIPGDVLWEMRNVYARGANRKTGVDSGADRQIANRFDRMITNQLPTKDVDEFNDQIGSWRAAMAYADTTRQKGPENNFGRFTSKDYQGPSIKLGGRGTSDKRPVLQDERRQAWRARQGATDIGEKELELRKKAKSEADRLKKSARDKKKQQSYLLSDEKRAQQQALVENRLSGDISQAKASLESSMDRLRQLNSNKASGKSNLLTTAALGAGVAPWSLLGVLPAGVGTAAGLSTKAGQRMVAGQTGPQRALANAIRTGKTAPYTRAISRTSALNGEEEEQY